MIRTVSIGFTGTRKGMTDNQLKDTYFFLEKVFTPHAKFHHGACVGSDEQAVKMAREIGYWVVAHPPTLSNQLSHVAVDLSHELRPDYDYITRDHHIVDETEILVATPETLDEVVRSGTWTTIRYSKRTYPKTKYVHIIWP